MGRGDDRFDGRRGRSRGMECATTRAAPGSPLHDLPEDQRFLNRNRVLLAIAPDGSRVAYTANNQLYLRNLNETTAQPIPGTDEGPRNPFFSPDGEWIAYWASGQLKKIAVDGGVRSHFQTWAFLATPSGVKTTPSCSGWRQV